jgi:ferric-dicitrate binding protein FerR (iron transport regulator)
LQRHYKKEQVNDSTDMNKLIYKYEKGMLTPDELSELKITLNAMPDAEAERLLYEAWLDDDTDASSVDDGLIDRIKDNINIAIGRRRSGMSLFLRWGQIAAAALLPVFILLSVYLYRENSHIASEEMFVTTGKAERAGITLPDGTVVTLNAESKLGYRPKDYNRKERKIHFAGEGYFRVFHNEEIPFFITAKGLQVKVLGTVFNLSVRETDHSAELALEEGSVHLLSTRNNENVTLHKNQKAILEYRTGNITVINDENIKDKSAWRRGDMIFRNTELSQVIRTIEENYNVTVKVDCKECLTEAFTGTLPVNNLNEALEVIEYSYHLKAVLSKKKIVMKKN